MDIRKIEITEERLLLGTMEYRAGDIKSMAKADADLYIKLGWARCVESGEQGTRTPGAQQIAVGAVAQAAK